MSVHVVSQSVAGYGAEVVSPLPGVRQLVAGMAGTNLLVHVPARIGGLSDTARFARSLAAAASEFGEWCEMQNRARSHSSPLPDQWPNTRLEPAPIGHDTSGSAAE
ncbi:MAG: hypothetical protein ACRDSH_26200 [Pseudonocardiaceae bacterium]